MKADDDFRSPDPSNLPDITATPEQILLAVAQAKTLPTRGDNVEYACWYKDGKWSTWKRGSQSRSEIDGSADFNLHSHTRLSDMRANRKNFFPGPGDPAAVHKTRKPSFIITPDRNTILLLGIKSGKYFCRPVWQRSGTAQKMDYTAWAVTNDP